MDATEQKTVLIGVSGGVAAYKSCEIARGLQKAGVRVKVMMTEHATHFVDPLTFRSLTHEPVAVGLFDDPSDPIHHISLAQEADAVLVAPCTANVMAKAAHGIADDLFSTTLLATTAPIVLAPAMNVHMYENPATQANMQTLKARGFRFVEADSGYLACGDVGRGRLADPERIVSFVLDVVNRASEAPKRDLAGKRVMVTAGPTVEPIDPVRYLSNRRSRARSRGNACIGACCPARARRRGSALRGNGARHARRRRRDLRKRRHRAVRRRSGRHAPLEPRQQEAQEG